MSTYMIVLAQIEDRDSIQLLETTRDVCRTLRQEKHCSAFLPINRSKLGRVDCYLFDVTIPRDDIQKLFSSSLNCQLDVQEKEMSADLQLVKSAAIVVDILLTQYADNERTLKVFSEHFHYILNGLGMGYKDEINFYLFAIHQVEQLLRRGSISANAS